MSDLRSGFWLENDYLGGLGPHMCTRSRVEMNPHMKQIVATPEV